LYRILYLHQNELKGFGFLLPETKKGEEEERTIVHIKIYKTLEVAHMVRVLYI
jgi:hypothetical protein